MFNKILSTKNILLYTHIKIGEKCEQSILDKVSRRKNQEETEVKIPIISQGSKISYRASQKTNIFGLLFTSSAIMIHLLVLIPMHREWTTDGDKLTVFVTTCILALISTKRSEIEIAILDYVKMLLP